jgi:uncharacterized Ntn-hydrolase superfamily protein
MKNGLSAKQALAAVLAGDEDRERRQLAIVDAHGGVAGFTGSSALAYKGDVQGDGYSCQANMMLKPGVPEAMAKAFEASSGPLEWRILTALDAAQDAGGDARGMQSAAILVRPPAESVAPGPHFTHPGTDFRVDHSDHPLKAMRALIENRDVEKALRSEEVTDSLETARKVFAESEGRTLTVEAAFWHAVRTLSIKHGQHDEAMAIMEPIIANGSNWVVMLHNLPEVPADSPLRSRFPL